jgi:hypothetical protein
MPVPKPEPEGHVQQVVYMQPMQTPEYLREQRIRANAAHRRDPLSRQEAQAKLDAAPKVLVILEPNDDERRWGDAHLDANGEPQYPRWECGYNGLRLSYPLGEQIELPVYIWELYAHNRRLPRHRAIHSATAGVFSREIPEEGAVFSGTAADFGR